MSKEIKKRCYNCKYSRKNNPSGKTCCKAYPEIYKNCDSNYSEWQVKESEE